MILIVIGITALFIILIIIAALLIAIRMSDEEYDIYEPKIDKYGSTLGYKEDSLSELD